MVLALDLAWGSSKAPDQDDLRGDAWVWRGIRKGCMGKRCIVHMALDASSMGRDHGGELTAWLFWAGRAPGKRLNRRIFDTLTRRRLQP